MSSKKLAVRVASLLAEQLKTKIFDKKRKLEKSQFRVET